MEHIQITPRLPEDNDRIFRILIFLFILSLFFWLSSCKTHEKGYNYKKHKKTIVISRTNCINKHY